MRRRMLTCLLLVLATLSVGCAANRDPWFGGAVAADHPLASEAGVEILRAGGNAIDAAVATSVALSVVRPYSCGIGGGGFMVVHLPDDPRHGRVQAALNYREASPGQVGPDFFEGRATGASVRGGAAVAVPGTVAGLLEALERWGTLPREVVLAPAIRLAEEGYPVDRHYVETAREQIDRFEANPDWKERFAFVWERFLFEGEVEVGDRLVLPEQARALRLIAEHGAEPFYRGEIARAIERAAQESGGVLDRADLSRYAPVEVEPLGFTFQSHRFVTMPPPSSGGVAMAQTLGILQRTHVAACAPFSPASFGAPPAAGYIHLLAEAFQHAFADRAAHLADPAFVDLPLDRLLSDAYLDHLASRISMFGTFDAAHYGTVAAPPDDGGTSHFSVVDRFGGAVACTETINLAFGSLVAVPQFGFCLNNEMDDFTTRRGTANAFGLRQSDANLPEPGKRPLSSMTPTIVLDAHDRVRIVAGGSGGPRIITATTQVILNVLVRDMPADAAVHAERMHHQWLPRRILLEMPRTTVLGAPDPAEQLRQLGHDVRTAEAIGVVQLIVRDEDSGGWRAVSDGRKAAGAARGY